jgi:ABC-type nitrate/sulfonate/bicarbonate transport system substrate-binding protein
VILGATSYIALKKYFKPSDERLGDLMGRAIVFLILTLLPSLAFGQSFPKVRMAYTSINIQMTPIYMMKELDLPRKQGLDVEILYIPVSSRAVQAALAGEIHFLTSGGIANINANMAGADFVGITATLNTFAFKIIVEKICATG